MTVELCRMIVEPGHPEDFALLADLSTNRAADRSAEERLDENDNDQPEIDSVGSTHERIMKLV